MVCSIIWDEPKIATISNIVVFSHKNSLLFDRINIFYLFKDKI